MYITDPFGRRKPTAARHLRELGDYDSRVHYLLVGFPLYVQNLYLKNRLKKLKKLQRNIISFECFRSCICQFSSFDQPISYLPWVDPRLFLQLLFDSLCQVKGDNSGSAYTFSAAILNWAILSGYTWTTACWYSYERFPNDGICRMVELVVVKPN